MKIPKLKSGYERKWMQCKECKRVYYYDYIPYSLSAPIMTTNCGHSIGYDRDMNCIEISEYKAQALLSSQS